MVIPVQCSCRLSAVVSVHHSVYVFWAQHWSHAGLSVALCKYFGSVLVSCRLVCCIMYFGSVLVSRRSVLSVVLHKSFEVSIGLIDAGLSVVLCKCFGVSIGLQLACLLYYVSIFGQYWSQQICLLCYISLLGSALVSLTQVYLLYYVSILGSALVSSWSACCIM